jgi:hypothetical protein
MSKEKKTAKKRILKAKIDFISLCPKGANTLKTVYKAEDGQDQDVSFSVLSKDMTEQGELLAVVYSPDLVDSQGDTASAEVIKEMAYGFARDGKGIDIRHNSELVAKEAAFIAESFIIQKDDPRFKGFKDYEGTEIDVTGGWGAVIKIEDEDLRKKYKSGEWGGISMGGLMLAQDADENKSVLKSIKDLLNKVMEKQNSKNTEIDMDAKELAALLATNNTALVAALKEVLAPKAKTAEEVAAEKLAKENADKKVLGLGYVKPMLKDQPSTEELARFEKEMSIFELSKAVDREDVKAVREFQAMAKDIAAGKEIKKADGTNPYNSFFVSNQSDEDIKKASTDNYGDVVLKSIDEEEKAEAAAKRA